MDELEWRLEKRRLRLPLYIWQRIEAEVKDQDVTVEEWIQWLIYSQFAYRTSQDLEDDAERR